LVLWFAAQRTELCARAVYSPTPGASNNVSGTPPSSFIAYNTEGAPYSQDFDSLPDPGATSVNTANPVTINGVTYSLANPFDFAFPVSGTSGTGGLGLAAMSGWYGLADPTASVGTRFGATDGDQTTGGQISFRTARQFQSRFGAAGHQHDRLHCRRRQIHQ